jgi:LEA14-like dessication related protein
MKLVATMRAAALALLLTLAGCSSLAPKIEAPRLTIVRVAMTSGDIFSQNFLVQLNVQNPNDRELPIKGIDYKLFLQGDSFAEGVSARPFVVPALGETDFDMTVRTNFVSSVGRLLTRLNGKTTVEYIIEGKVLLQSGMVRNIPFQESGTVDLSTIR